MNDLTPRERELVALGAAMGSNCVPCIEYHIPESRNVGLTDPEIRAAIEHADKIRQVPARKVLEAALNMLASSAGAMDDAATCGASKAGQPFDKMATMMSKMMGVCGCLDQASATAPASGKKPTVGAATHEVRGSC